MPDQQGFLTTTEQNSIKRWLETKEAHRQLCPACGHNQWTIANRLAVCPTMGVDRSVDIGTIYPMVVVVCGRCAFYRFHSAIAMGIVPGVEELQKAGLGVQHGS